jgi:LCP family protein required for cell wall assembly
MDDGGARRQFANGSGERYSAPRHARRSAPPEDDDATTVMPAVNLNDQFRQQDDDIFANPDAGASHGLDSIFRDDGANPNGPSGPDEGDPEGPVGFDNDGTGAESEPPKKGIAGPVLTIVMGVLMATAVGLVWWTNLLPLKYILAALGAALVFGLAVGIPLWRTNPHLRKVRFGILTGLAIIAMIVSLYVDKVVYDFHDFTGGINNNSTVLVYDLIALKNYDGDVSSFKGKNVASLTNDPRLETITTEVEEQVQPTWVPATDISDMASKLKTGNVVGAVVNDSTLRSYGDDTAGYMDTIKVITTFQITIQTAQDSASAKAPSEPFLVYISGIDTYGGVATVGNSDVNILMAVDPKAHSILLVSTPRDYYVQLHGTTGLKDKLTHAGDYGIDMSENTISDLYQLKPDYYIRLNFSSVISIVDAIGGIDIDSPYDFTAISGEHFPKGEQHLNGGQALMFARERHAFLEGDRIRGENQERVIKAIFAKATEPAQLLNYNALLEALEPSLQTNMPQSMITGLIRQQLSDNADWTFDSMSVNGSDANEPTYSYGKQKLYVMIPDMSTVATAEEALKKQLGLS